MREPTLSVILLTYNTRDLTLNCLKAFYAAAQERRWQVIVVDNASTDDTAHAVTQIYQQVEVIVSPTNVGFAGGNNLGLRQAIGDVVILLNSDVVVTVEVLNSLAVYLQQHPDVGAVSPGLLTSEGQPQAYAYGDDPSPAYLLKRGLRTLLRQSTMHDWAIDHSIDVDWVSGACISVRRQVLQQVGLLDSGFFLYFEDNDWCLRMRQAGWRVVYNPEWKVIHLGGASQPRRQVANQVYYRSMLHFYSKHYSRLHTAVLRLAIAAYQRLTKVRSRQPVEVNSCER